MHICSGRRYLHADICEDVPHFLIKDDHIAQIFLCEGETGVEQLDEIILGLQQLRKDFINTLLPAGEDAYDAYWEAHPTEPQWEELPEDTKIAWAFAASNQAVVPQREFKIGNGRSPVVILKHNLQAKSMDVRVTNAAGMCVVPKITAVDDNTLALEFTPEELPGAGDQQYTVKLFPHG